MLLSLKKYFHIKYETPIPFNAKNVDKIREHISKLDIAYILDLDEQLPETIALQVFILFQMEHLYIFL